MDVPVNNEKKNSSKGCRIAVIILSIAVAVFLGLYIYEASRVNTIYLEAEQATTEKIELQSELDSLMRVHDQIKNEYGDMSNELVEKDSIILARAEEIKTLIAQQADYRRVKKKLKYLRSITQSYVTQVDSLLKVNEVLVEENKSIKKSYEAEQEKTSELTLQTEELTEKVSKASYLKAYNITATPLRLKSGGKKEVVTNKAKRVDKIKVCFTLSENLVLEAGKRTVYVRIARPDKKILVKGNENIYSFNFQGKKLQYSLKKEVDYKNKAVKVCMEWKKEDPKASAMKGTYYVTVFTEEREIGETSFTLE